VDGFDKLNKVRPLKTHLQECLSKLNPEEMNSVDEQIIPYKGRSSIKQYSTRMSRESPTNGVKTFTRAGMSGIMYQFEIYTGQGTCPDYGIGFSGNIVMHLSINIPDNQCYKVFTDNWFSSIKLASKLLDRGVYFVILFKYG